MSDLIKSSIADRTKWMPAEELDHTIPYVIVLQDFAGVVNTHVYLPGYVKKFAADREWFANSETETIIMMGIPRCYSDEFNFAADDDLNEDCEFFSCEPRQNGQNVDSGRIPANATETIPDIKMQVDEFRLPEFKLDQVVGSQGILERIRAIVGN